MDRCAGAEQRKDGPGDAVAERMWVDCVRGVGCLYTPRTNATAARASGTISDGVHVREGCIA